MNKRQKNIVLSFSSIVVAVLVIWILYGMEIFTKTQVLVEKKDELFGWSEKQWVNKFVPGLDLTAGVIFILFLLSALLFFLFRTPKNKSELSH